MAGVYPGRDPLARGREVIRVDQLSDYHIPSVLEAANIPPESHLLMFQCMRMSVVAWAGFVDDEIACLWGLVPPTLLSNKAYLWLVVNELVDAHKFAFVRHSQREMERMLRMYPIITGHCDKRHSRSMQWLKWLGARFDPEIGPVAPFTIVREDG
jgi:hypothetical protein